jgi:hypothetical protein
MVIRDGQPDGLVTRTDLLEALGVSAGLSTICDSGLAAGQLG